MEIKISTRQILNVLHVLSWILFLGLCVQACGFIFNVIFTLAVDLGEIKLFWDGADLSGLYSHDPGYFIVVAFFIILVSSMKALLFYLIIKILYDKKLDMSQPFSKEVGRFVFNISYLTLGIGLFSSWGAKYVEWFVQQGVKMPDIESLHLGGADVWLFMSVTLFVVAHIFKRGIEIQSENELTI